MLTVREERPKKSRVPAGSLRDSQIGPPSGSIVMSKRRNGQHCRSASTAEASTENASAENLKRTPSAVSSLLSARRARSGGRNVRFPARQYAVNGERRSFALLRPVADVTAQDGVRKAILEAYAEAEAAVAE